MSAEQGYNPLRVTFFGDSIFVGQGVSIHSGWVTRIAEYLEGIAEKRNREVVVTNASVNGSTTRQALERMPYQIQSHGVDILLVQFGLNDCNYWMTDGGLPRVSADGFAANLTEIMDRGRKFGAKWILLNNNHPTTRDEDIFPETSKTFEDSNREYNAVVRQIVSDAPDDVRFTDIEAAFESIVGRDRKKLADLLLPDGLHLSLRGHDVYFNAVVDTLEGCLMDLIHCGSPGDDRR
ncbi:MAG: hypothetical protein BMS9Abin05_2652 [Rhodothermia bacterium]|nr:MAG: hypothetical protein BMS9Abin05_2652 [Rhodothermia bacterium]